MNSLRLFDLNLLIIFEALISECHVSRAAEKVFLSQSAMSHALNRLRTQLDDPLLVKTENGLTPTPRALAMLPDVRQALSLVERTISPPESFQASLSDRTFRIASTDFFETVVFPDWFSQLQQSAPNVRVEIDLISEESALLRLEKGEIDLIVGMDKEQKLPSHLIVQDWLTQTQVCLANNNNQQIKGTLSLDDYLAMPHIRFFDLEGKTDSNIDRWLAGQSLSRNHIASTTNYMAAARIVANTDAIITLPYHMAKLFTQMMPVRIVTPPNNLPAMDMTLVQHPLYAKDPGIIWLKHVLSEHVQQQLMD